LLTADVSIHKYCSISAYCLIV